MFHFDLSTLDDRDLHNTIEAIDYLLTHEPGQDENPLYETLLETLDNELQRRQQASDQPAQREITLPIAEATGAHVWSLLVFASSVVKAAATGEPSMMGRFFGCVVNEIEAAALKMRASVEN